MEEELADPLRLVVVAVRLLERRDVGADQPRLVPLDARVGIGQGDLAGPDRLDLRAGQDDPCLERLVDVELMTRPPVEGDRLLVCHGVPCGTRMGARRRKAGPKAGSLSYPTHRVSD